MAKENKALTPEELARKDRVRFRMFILLLVFDLFLIGYFLFEIISIFAKK